MHKGADKNRYKITVDGTGVQEYHEFDENYSVEEVAEWWLDNASDKFGAGVGLAFSGRVNVEQIAKKDEPSALPPCKDEDIELTEE